MVGDTRQESNDKSNYWGSGLFNEERGNTLSNVRTKYAQTPFLLHSI